MVMKKLLFAVLLASVGCGGATTSDDAPCTTGDEAPTAPAPVPTSGDVSATSECASTRFYLVDPYVYDRDSHRVWFRAAPSSDSLASVCVIGAMSGARVATTEEIRDLKTASRCALPAPFVVAPGQLATPTGCIDVDTGADVACEGWIRRSLCVAGGP